MSQTEFRILDESQDRKYFAIVPNFITNHSTLKERGFYLTLKRIAGEDGKVYYSMRELAKQCGVGKDTVNRLINSLLKRGWIKEAGTIPAKTKPRMTYSIVNLWDKNNDFYRNQKIVSKQGQSPTKEKIVANQGQRSAQTRDTKEEPGKEDINTAEAEASVIKRNVDNSGDNRTPYGNCSGCTDPDPLGGTHSEGTYQHPFPERRNTISSIGDILKGLKLKPDAPQKGGTKYPWQDEAIRIWQEIGLRGSPSGSFFKLFKLAYQKGEQGKLATCLSYCKDAEGIKNMERLFYWRFANEPGTAGAQRKHDL